ncbi:heme ABC exporter ATP-binding protein CcmA [bacterium]|nr:heme ABC exporter ATP-binding protein CcmA [bacterium]
MAEIQRLPHSTSTFFPEINKEVELETAAIKVTGLNKTFGNLHALRDISFELAKGEFLAVFGPNGAGKTTLIRILSTLMKPSSGKVTVCGVSVEEEPQKLRSQIGVIAHQTFLYEELTAEENLTFYGRLYQVADLSSKIEDTIREVGLEWRRHDQVRTFSRGMQQRLSIARAMLHDPTVLLLDEPYTGLDQHGSEMLSGWLRALKNGERTTIMVTHDLRTGLDLADRVTILNRGRIALEQPSGGLKLNAFRNTYNQLIAANGQKHVR